MSDRSICLPAFCASLLAIAGPGVVPAAHATTVLLLAADDPADVTLAATGLVASGVFVDDDLTELPGSAAPELADLTPHDVVLVWSDGAWDDVDALGEVLADYVDAGGAVVLATHALEAGFLPAGRFSSTPYSPVVEVAPASVAGDVDFAAAETDLDHPILAGLTDVGFPDATPGSPALSSVGLDVAVDTAGNRVVAATCDRSVVAVAIHPPDLALEPPDTTADARLLVAQAITATALNTAPTADAGDDIAVVEGGGGTLDGSGSLEGDLGPLTYAWDLDGDGLFDDSGEVSPGFDASTLDGPSSVTVSLRVTNACGVESVDEASVTIANADPSIESVSQDGPIDEATAVALSATGSDPGDDPLTFTWDFDDGSPTETGASVSHVYSDDGSFDVLLTVSDGDGGSAETVETVIVGNVAPSLVATVHDPSAAVGTEVPFFAEFADVAGAADPVTATWDFGDGSPTESGVDLLAVDHAFDSLGLQTVTVTADDGDGGSLSVDLLVDVFNPGPTLELVTGPGGTVEEATSATWTVAAADSQGNAVTVSWSWGDGSPVESGLGLLTRSHTYGDQGTPTIEVVAMDTFGAEVSLSEGVVVVNTDPSFVGSPTTSAVEGQTWSFTLSASDVPADLGDLSFALPIAPLGASLDPVTDVVSWVPSYSQAFAGPLDFLAAVTDGDGGSATLSWAVTASPLDVDGDGIPDTYEADVGLDPSVDDAGLDPDGDGISNLDEYLGGTDPGSFDGPGAPTAVSPVDGVTVTAAAPTLTVANATDPGGDALTYSFEVYAEPALATLLDASSDVPAGASTTSTVVSTPLPEDAMAWWRARASDGLAAGPWTVAEPFFVDTVNGAPTVPAPLSPSDELVTTGMPVFVTSAVSDPEGAAVEVEVHIATADETPLETVSATEQLDGTWHAVPTAPLAEDAAYRWRASAIDVVGAESALSAWADFAVDVTNSAPDAPAAVAPVPDSEIHEDRPTLVVTTAPDGDGDPLVVRFEADTTPDFASPDRQLLGTVAPDADGVATAPVALPLPENGVAWARARVQDDRGAASAWLVWSFLVDAVAEAPGRVRIVAPGEAEVVDGEDVTVRWAVADDPEGDPLTYELEIVDELDLEVVWTMAGLEIPDGDIEGSVAVDVNLEPGGFLVRGRASDVEAGPGEWGADNRFAVLPTSGDPVDLGSGEPPYGCDCASSASGSRGGGGWLAAVLVGLALRTGRRRRWRCAR